ncbi:MAG: antitoxin VapB family protein [Candidatus Bathyarchaeia archaeon]
MGYKTISLSDEAYNKLASLKKKGESFADVILRLCSEAPKKNLTSFAGAWIMSDEEEKKIFGEISELWRKYEENMLGHRFSSSITTQTPRSSQKS